MKNTLLFSILSIALIFFSCTDDVGFIDVTYFEASPIYGDLEQIRSLPLNSDPKPISNPGKIYVSNDIILIGEEEVGIHVIDNADASQPQTINFINLPGNREFVVEGQFIYAETYYDVVKIDFSNPSQAVLSSRAKNVFADEITNDAGETLLGFTFTELTAEMDQDSDLFKELNSGNVVYLDYARRIIPKSAIPSSFSGNSNLSSGTVNRISKYKEHVYVVGRFDLHVLRDGNELIQVTKVFEVGEEMETVFPKDDHLFVGSRSSIEIFDISQAEYPVHKYRFDHATSCDPVLPVEDVAYVSLRTADFSECPGNINALIVLDITDLESPVQLDEIQMNSPYGMTKIGDFLYVGEGINGLSIFDASDPEKLSKLSTDSSIQAYDVIAHPNRSDLVLIAGPTGLDQYSIDENLNLLLESRISY